MEFRFRVQPEAAAAVEIEQTLPRQRPIQVVRPFVREPEPPGPSPAEDFDISLGGQNPNAERPAFLQEQSADDQLHMQLDPPQVQGSMESRLQKAVVVDIKRDGRVTLHLDGPGYESYKQMSFNFSTEHVQTCTPGLWYIVEYEVGGQRYHARAVAQYACEDSQAFMMHFADFDVMSEEPLTSIFEVWNLVDVCRVPIQGTTVEVMGLTDKDVSPQTVEHLAAEWCNQTVYVIPIGTNPEHVPIVRLIHETGRLLDM